MDNFLDGWRIILAVLLTPPWKEVVSRYDNTGSPRHIVPKPGQLAVWGVGWLMTLAGIVGTGIFMPYLVVAWHIPTNFQSYAVIIGAFLGGLLWQGAVIVLVAIGIGLSQTSRNLFPNESLGMVLDSFVSAIMGLLILLLPFGATGYLLYRYFSNFAPHHDLVGTGILGATLLKLAITFGIPFVKGLVTGRIFAWILRKIRNERPPRPKGKPLPINAE